MSNIHAAQTLCLHGGSGTGHEHGALVPPLHLNTAYRRRVVGEDQTYSYSRVANPTVAALEARLGALEDALPAVCFGSGLAAITTLLLTVLRAGDRVVCSDVAYGGTHRLLDEVLAPLGVSATYVDTAGLDALRGVLGPEVRLLLIETPANPTLKLTDVAACCGLARDRGVLSVVDNTFLTPVLQRPLDLGADATVYSTTKAVEGHGTALGGAITTRDAALRERLAYLRKSLGTIQSPQSAWQTLQGLKTLPLRLARQTQSARQVAAALRDLPGVVHVAHPDLPDFPQAELARRQQNAGGGLVTFTLAGGLEAAARAAGALRLCTPAENLGAAETLVTHCASQTHACLAPSRRRELGIDDGLLRLSVGLEDPAAIIADLEQALAAAAKEVRHA